MKRNRRGFVLVELLAAVAVLIVTFSITSVNAGEINKQLNQSKAVSTARDIFIEAQYNLTALKASGKLELLNDNDGPLSQVVNNSDLSFITSQNDNRKNFVNDEEYGGSYIIEFDPTTGMVAGVWWASKEDLNGFNQMLTPEKKYKELDEASNTELLEFAEKNKYNIYHYTNDVSAVIASSGPGEIKKQDPQKEPDPVISTGFCYYEVYEDGSVGTFIFAKNEDNLNNSSTKYVVGDGYGVILNKSADSSKVSVSGTKSLSSLKGCQTLTIDGGYIYMFPVDWMRANNMENSAITGSIAPYQNKYDQNYWWDVTINYNDKGTNEIWSYSPYYAKTAVPKAAVNGQNLPSEVSIRSARQLSALSWQYSSYLNEKSAWGWHETRVTGTTFKQEKDIYYDKYQFSTYTGRTYVGQMSIGTDWGRFLSNYNGCGNTIYNVKILRRNKTSGEFTYAGLFGLVSLGTIEDVHIDSTGATLSDGTPMNTIDNADYCGVLAAYVQNANIKNCSVKNYVINYSGSTCKAGLSAADEYRHARIGSFIGYIKCQSTNEQGTSYIYNNSVYGCSINATNLDSSTTNSDATNRYYNIGGFVGSIADRESNESNANKVTISKCTISNTNISAKDKYGYDASGDQFYFNVGGFAGAIRKYVIMYPEGDKTKTNKERTALYTNVTGISTKKQTKIYVES